MDLATACWNYHLFGIPVDESAGLVSVHCEVGQRVTRTVDVQLAGYVSWTCTQMGQEGVGQPLISTLIFNFTLHYLNQGWAFIYPEEPH